LYLRSVGRNGALLLNVPPDHRGLIDVADSAALMEFRSLRGQSFSSDRVRTFAEDTAARATWNVTLVDTATFNCLALSEDISLGQRVAAFRVEAWDGTAWRHLTSGTTIGHKRILVVPPTSAERIRVVVEDARAPAVIGAICVYSVPRAVLDVVR
jgi:alpha-L-fucosidase